MCLISFVTIGFVADKIVFLISFVVIRLVISLVCSPKNICNNYHSPQNFLATRKLGKINNYLN